MTTQKIYFGIYKVHMAYEGCERCETLSVSGPVSQLEPMLGKGRYTTLRQAFKTGAKTYYQIKPLTSFDFDVVNACP